jgi:gamma-butyrobetaine dioxygenase
MMEALFACLPVAHIPGEPVPIAAETRTDIALLSADTVTILSDRVVVRWSDRSCDEFHHLWLRDNCGCSQCRHPIVGERLSDPAAIELDLVPVSAVGGESIELVWPDGHRSAFAPAWLRTHAYGPSATARRTSPLRFWTAADVQTPPQMQFEEVMASDEALLEWLRLLRAFGFTIVRGVPTDPGTVAKLATRVGNLRDSNFGLIWEVESMPKPDSLAYTSVKLTAHTDLVSREAQPGLQFLHCLVNEASGGESFLVDGFSVAEELKHQSREHFDTLTRVNSSFRYQNDFTDVRTSFPVIRLDHNGDYYEVRYSNALMAPLQCDPNDVVPFYAAYKQYSRILRDPKWEYSFRLEAGDCEVFDNRRVMHGRQEFDPQTGRRHLQGCYVDTDDFLSRLRVLERANDWRTR